MKVREVNRRIERLGGLNMGQRGSHRKYKVTVDGTTVSTVVPQHAGRDIPIGTLSAIQRDLEPALGKGWLS